MNAGPFHLTYCSNVHPAETWQDVQASLTTYLPEVRRHLGFEGPLAIGLRLSAVAAQELDHDATLTAFREFLERGNYYIFTINGFPYGAFHGERVKEQVYLPDWRDQRRLTYTNTLARLLAALLPAGVAEGSISTVPGAFKRAVTGRDDVAAIVRMLLTHAAYLADIRERTGRTIVLALEPERSCLLETTAETADFFQSWLFDPRVLDAHGSGLTREDIQRHLGVCYDACHMAVEYEDAAASIEALQAAGIKIAKVQISAGLKLRPTAETARRLIPFAEDTYLHQVVERRGSTIARFVDLPDALAAAPSAEGEREWRVHFHLPIYLDEVQGLATTTDDLVKLLDVLKARDVCPYLEVETYTWSVLAPQFRTLDLAEAIARELAWVRDRLR